jgi:cobalamin biosynthesis Mg chelatase CobN
MFTTSALYFLVAIFGERIESSEAHGVLFVEGQEDETAESAHNENQQEAQNQILNESSESPEQRQQEGQIEQHGGEKAPSSSEANESKHTEEIGTEEASHKESASETQRRNLEFPFSIGAGVGYAVIGLWLIFDKSNSKKPYIIVLVGSLIILVMYVFSRTVGIFNLGIEPIGILDLIVATLQGGIIIGSSYILLTKTYTIKE